MPMAMTYDVSSFNAGLRGNCASYAAVCAARPPDGRSSSARAISTSDGSPFIIRSTGSEVSELPAAFACPCTGTLSDVIRDVFAAANAADDGDSLLLPNEEAGAESEVRPMILSDGRPEVTLDARELVLRVEGRAIGLTRTQFSILSYLVQNSGRWVTTGELIRQVLGTHHQPDTSLVRVHVHAIRRRLGTRAVWLESDRRRARGYRWRGIGGDRDDPSQKSS